MHAMLPQMSGYALLTRGQLQLPIEVAVECSSSGVRVGIRNMQSSVAGLLMLDGQNADLILQVLGFNDAREHAPDQLVDSLVS